MSRFLRAAALFCVFVIRFAHAAPTAAALSQLEVLKAQAKQHGWKLKLGYNPIMEYALEDVTGLRIEKNWRMKGTFFLFEKKRLPSSFDWRQKAGGLTPIKNQGGCGSCWAFGTVAAFENAIKIFDHVVKPLSEQQLVDCDDRSFGCSGGYAAHYIHMNPGAATSDEYPYQASNGQCHEEQDYPDKIQDWNYVGSADSQPSSDEIKQAIYDYGVVTTGVYASGYMQAYQGGIYDACQNGPINHMVALVGWNDSHGGYWIMRNSWGSRWGEEGYMRIPYECSGIGYGTSFVKYKPKCTPQPIIYAGRDKTITSGQSVHLGSMPIDGQTYQWTPSTGLDNPSSSMPSASPASDTVYTLKVTNRCGTVEQKVKVTVN